MKLEPYTAEDLERATPVLKEFGGDVPDMDWQLVIVALALEVTDLRDSERMSWKVAGELGVKVRTLNVQIAAALALHADAEWPRVGESGEEIPVCAHDNLPQPCPTVRALTGETP